MCYSPWIYSVLLAKFVQMSIFFSPSLSTFVENQLIFMCDFMCRHSLFCSLNLYPNANTILQKSYVFSRHSWNYDKLVNLQVEKNMRPCTVLVMNKTFWVSLGYDLCLPLYLMWVWIILYESVVTMYCCLPCRKSKYFQMAISWFLKIIITILFIDFVVYFIIFIYYINTQK